VVEGELEAKEETPALLLARLPAVVGNAGTELVLLFFSLGATYARLMRLRLRPISWDWTQARSAASALAVFYGNGNLKSAPRNQDRIFGIRRGRRLCGRCRYRLSCRCVFIDDSRWWWVCPVRLLFASFPPPPPPPKPKPPLPTVSGWRLANQVKSQIL
jgi:hypothetical protein